MDGVALHIAYHVLGIVEPTLLDVALGEPCPRLGVDGWLRLVQSAHVVERGSSLVERSLVELRASHEQPRLPKERVVLAAREPLQVLRRLLALLCPLRSALYAMQLDGLLTLLDGAVVVRLAYLSAVLVAHGVERNKLGEVVLVAFLLLKRGIDIRQRAVIISVITRLERVPPACARGVFLRRASCRNHQYSCEKDGYNMSCLK